MREVKKITPARGRHPSAVYNISGGLPWYRELEVQPTQSAAWVKWAAEYRARDPYGNMANALGFVHDPAAGGWRGVVNYYHSNT